MPQLVVLFVKEDDNLFGFVVQIKGVRTRKAKGSAWCLVPSEHSVSIGISATIMSIIIIIFSQREE